LLELGQDLEQAQVHCVVEGVVLVRVVVGDRGDRPVHLEAHAIVAHGSILSARRDSRSSYFSTFPVALTGSASTTRTVRGTLKLAMRSRAQARSPSGSTSRPGAGTTTAAPTSPRRSSGRPTTATWPTSGWSRST